MNTATAAQRTNKRQDAIWERATRLKKERDDKAKQEHSPLPFHASRFGVINDARGKQIAMITLGEPITESERDANAELIVRAVNNAEKLAEALKEIERKTRISDPDVVSLHDIASYALADWQKGQQQP